jgi:hypothetical protein
MTFSFITAKGKETPLDPREKRAGMTQLMDARQISAGMTDSRPIVMHPGPP